MANTKRSRTAKPAPPALAADEESSPVTGIRIPRDVLSGLDAWVDELNRDPERLGNATRGRLVVRILRAALEDRSKRGAPSEL